MNLTNCLNNTNKEGTMDLIEAWLKTNTPTKCPDCYCTPDKALLTRAFTKAH